MTIYQLSNKFPGELCQKDDYHFFLPGDLFLAQGFTFELPILRKLERATLKLGQFSEKIKDIPDAERFILVYSRKEARQSTRIEGTQTNVEETFQEEEQAIPQENRDDWQELQQYIIAMHHAVEKLDSVPLGIRLIKESHHILLSQARGRHRLPGEFRTSQNWLGGSRPSNAHFVPPSSEHILEAMSNLERFIHDEQTIPHLIKIALIHYQFETIHPFLDGNGRMGRMLIPLYLMAQGIIEKPILYISDFFESNRNDYYDALDQGRQSKEGLIKWVSFFLDGVIETADKGLESTNAIISLQDEVMQKISKLRRQTKNTKALADMLFIKPFVTSKDLHSRLECSKGAAQQLLKDFVDLNILTERTGQKRNRKYYFDRYVKILFADEADEI